MIHDTASIDGISIGVLTHDRASSFGKLLTHLKSAIEGNPHVCELIVANNSGVAAHDLIEDIVDQSGIGNLCEYRVIDSPRNSVSVGRNIVLDAARYRLLVFVDDDEYPEHEWLSNIVGALIDLKCDAIAGPIVPVFPESANHWVRSVDLHNTQGLTTGERVDYAASGNFILDTRVSGEQRFAENYGNSGGEDTEYFLRLKDRGLVLCWCATAIVWEDIPVDKSTARYMMTRFMTQGATYRKILQERGEIGVSWFFSMRALLIFSVFGPIAVFLILIRHSQAGNCMKRAFSNLGKVVRLDRKLYQ